MNHVTFGALWVNRAKAIAPDKNGPQSTYRGQTQQSGQYKILVRRSALDPDLTTAEIRLEDGSLEVVRLNGKGEHVSSYGLTRKGSTIKDTELVSDAVQAIGHFRDQKSQKLASNTLPGDLAQNPPVSPARPPSLRDTLMTNITRLFPRLWSKPDQQAPPEQS